MKKLGKGTQAQAKEDTDQDTGQRKQRKVVERKVQGEENKKVNYYYLYFN